MNATLYLTRNGLLEPLGQSQVFSYLRGLSVDHAITLITLEKPEDLADKDRMEATRQECARYRIRWLPQQFRAKPRIIAPVLSMLRMLWLVLREVRAGRAALVHARSYIPAAVALAANRLTGVPFIFDMRALWPEELITARRLRRGFFLHRAIVWMERACLQHAAAVVSLTHAAVDHLQRSYPVALGGQRVVVIPTCADLARFSPAPPSERGVMVHGCIGTILSGWFRADWLAAWFADVAARDSTARFEVITRDDPDAVRAAVDPDGVLKDRLTIEPRLPDAMPDAVRGHDCSVMFFSSGLSKLGSAPTRLAEVLGCGLPVVANAGVGDVAQIVAENRVGVLLEGPAPAQVARALDELELLMADPELAVRCRATAERLFSLESGTEAYRKLYEAVLSRPL